MSLEMVSEVLTMATVVVYILLPLTYWVLAKRWYTTKTGRAVMWLLTALALSLIYIFFGVFLGQHDWRAEFRIVTLLYILAAGARFLSLILETQIGNFQRRRKGVSV